MPILNEIKNWQKPDRIKSGAGYSGAAFIYRRRVSCRLLLLFMKPGITFAGQ